VIRFELPTVPPSANDERRTHWRTRHARTRDWKAVAVALIRSLHLERDPERPCVVTLTFECRGDPDNRAKHMLDSLVLAGLLHDDKWPWVYELRLRGRRITRGEVTTCEIADCDQEGRTI